MIGAAAGVASGRRRHTDHVARSRIFLLAALLGSVSAHAQTWRIIPSITVAETLTDNVALAPAHLKESDAITQISPGVRVEGTQGRLKLDLNYRAQGLLYAKHSDQNDIQNYLEAVGSLEAVQSWLFIDARASITQQVFSAFAPQSTFATETINPNRAETLGYQLSPYIRGKLGANADYVLRYSLTGSKVRGGGDLGESQVEDWLGTITGPAAPTGLEWALTGNYQIAHSDLGRDVSSRRLYGSLGYRFDPQVRVSARAGWESNNYATTNSESAVTYGAQVEWFPTDRTRFNALAERRPLTNTYEVGFQHRTRLTAWRYSDSKTITTLPAQLALGRTTTAFDLLFDALASQFPDPIVRTEQANRLLQQNAIPRDLALTPFFVSSTVLVQRAHQGSFVLLGARNTVTVAGSVIETRSAETGVPVASDFSGASDIEQRSLSASWAHQLSANTAVTLTAAHTRNIGTGVDAQESKEFTARVSLTHQFSPRTYGSLSARHIRFDSSRPGADVREKAITGSLAVTFY